MLLDIYVKRYTDHGKNRKEYAREYYVVFHDSSAIILRENGEASLITLNDYSHEYIEKTSPNFIRVNLPENIVSRLLFNASERHQPTPNSRRLGQELVEIIKNNLRVSE